jgi:type IV secretory pathway VirB10-like protein
MSAKRLLLFSFLMSVLVSLLFPQSLAEIAKKERERRAKLKGRTVAVVTNADLAKMKKKPALETPPAPPEPGPETAEPPEASATPPSAVAESQESQAQAVAPPESGSPSNLKALQERWEKAKEYVELLTLKMSALWQQFYGLVDAGAKEAVQKSIGETFIKLQDAQQEETRARLELEEFLKQQKSESTPPIWIR